MIAGNGQRGHTGDGGPATAASFGGIGGFEVDHDKSIVVAEYDNWIRFVDPNGSVSTIAGNGEEGYAGDGGPAREAVLRHPHDLALRIDREVIVADSHNGVLRRIDPSGTITTFATGFVAPIAVKGGAGNSLYVADGGQNAVFRLSADGQEQAARRPRERADQPRRGRQGQRVRLGDRRRPARAARVAVGPGAGSGPLDEQARHVHDGDAGEVAAEHVARVEPAGRPPRDIAADLDDDLERRTRSAGEEEDAEDVVRHEAADPGAGDRRRAGDQRKHGESSERDLPSLGDRRRDPEALGHVVDHEADDEERPERKLAERERRADREPLAEVVQADADGDERRERDPADGPFTRSEAPRSSVRNK